MRVTDRQRRLPRGTAGVAATAAVIVGAACAGGGPPAGSVSGEARVSGESRVTPADCTGGPLDGAGQPAGSAVQWLDHAAAGDRLELDGWCRGVGAPVIAAAAGSAVRLDSVALITWNIHLGAARLDALVADLRSGSLTGAPAEHFVLLVQEARRRGGTVPVVVPRDARTARHLGERSAGSRADIVATAARLGLGLFYAPSMRNGGAESAAEDRGNAILTSLPFTAAAAIELPLVAQRRVAVAATILLLDVAGRRRELRVTSVHLDYGASRSRPLAPFGPGRTLQAGALTDALAGQGNSVVGGDFNTWSLPLLEGGLARMRAAFPDLPAGTTAPTHFTAGVVPRQLDHLFLRAADVTGSRPVRIDDRYGSDHFPLLTWIRLDPLPAQRDEAPPEA
jgi:endonuclease/exonuclease/phosphatase family metal-dependent hydrolase